MGGSFQISTSAHIALAIESCSYIRADNIYSDSRADSSGTAHGEAAGAHFGSGAFLSGDDEVVLLLLILLLFRAFTCLRGGVILFVVVLLLFLVIPIHLKDVAAGGGDLRAFFHLRDRCAVQDVDGNGGVDADVLGIASVIAALGISCFWIARGQRIGTGGTGGIHLTVQLIAE